jgi:site-specific recombinase XerD
VLRGFYRRARCAPASVTAAAIRDHVNGLVADHYSWTWIGMNISVLRSVFDKLAGQALTNHLSTPKRPMRLPDILSPGEVRQILAAAVTTRDQLLLGLLYGCGLKVTEVCGLKWADVDMERSAIRVRHARDNRERTLDLPPELLPVLKMGHSRCPGDDYIFQGRIAGTHLSTRMAQLVVRNAAKSAGTLKTVTCMSLRHAFAVHCLENGDSARALQEALGHESIETTLLYERCILPEGATSPLDSMRQPEKDQPPPRPDLFQQPISVDAMELPFREESSGNRARDFYELLKTHILGRFLCRRRLTPRSSGCGARVTIRAD